MERIIHFTVPSVLTALQSEAIARARSLHPGWDVHVWTDPVDFEGARLRDWYERPPTGAGRADLIRLDVVLRFGGIYLDSDIILERPLDRLADLDHFFCSEDGEVLTNAAFGAAIGHPIVRSLVDALLASEPDWVASPIVTTGPRFFAEHLHWWPGLQLLPRDTFYPYNWDEPQRPSLPTTHGVHRWVTSWWTPEQRAHYDAIRLGTSPRRSTDSSSQRGVRSALGGAVRRLLRPLAKALRSGLRIVLPPPPKLKRSQVARPPVYSAEGTVMVVTDERLTMALPADDLSVTPEIVATGTYEPDELRFLRSVLRGGDLVVDVGCNVGIHTLVAARAVGRFGRVVAFDPNPRATAHLRWSLVANWLHDRVLIEEVAVGDVAGRAAFSHPLNSFGAGSLVTERLSSHAALRNLLGSSVAREVDVVTLDGRFPLGVEIKVLKVDVEGHDHAVLAGARRLFEERCVAHLLVEAWREVGPEGFDRLIDELELIEGWGYVAHRLERGGKRSDSIPVASLRVWSEDGGRNVVLSRSD